MSYIGKYFYVELYGDDKKKTLPYNVLYQCVNIINENNETFFIMKNQAGQQEKFSIDRLVSEVLATAKPKYSVGQSVSAVVQYHMNEPIDNYCKIVEVITFCNNISYRVITIKGNQSYTVSQEAIKRIAVMPTPKFNIGQRVGVKIIYGGGLDQSIENGVISKVNLWFDCIMYEVSLDSGKTESAYEGHIGNPFTPPPRVDLKILLKEREAQLIKELEEIRQRLSTL